MYGRDARVPTSLDFYQPTSTMPIVETEFARELFSDLKRARKLAQQEIKKAQGKLTEQYDKSAKESVVKENDLVMLKVEPQFKLDRTFRGPYRVESVTSTNVVIRPVNYPTAEPWNVSIQRVFKCNQLLSSSSPWFGDEEKEEAPDSQAKRMMEKLLNHKLFRPDAADPFDDLPGIKTLYHKVQPRKVGEVVRP